MAAVRYLHAAGMQVLVSESAPTEKLNKDDLIMLKELGVRLETGRHTPDFFAGADLVVPSPGVPLDLPMFDHLRDTGVRIIGELALAAGRINHPVVAVTGSNGKTTVTSLIGHLMAKAGRKVFVGGNIGTPILAYLQGGQDAEAVVLELSSFQLEIGGGFRPDTGILLNISPDHLDRHGSMARYAAAKKMLFAHQKSGDTAILSTDDPLLQAKPPGGASTLLRFGLRRDADARVTEQGVMLAASLSETGAEEYFDLAGTSLSSLVNRLNGAAAILAARIHGCPADAIRAGLGDFQPPPHRMALVEVVNGVRYIDDSKGTNIGAVEAALASSGTRVILIAGGRDKGSDFSLLAPAVQSHVKHLILLGEAAARMQDALGSRVPTSRVATMEEAVRAAAESAEAGDTVLLSPGCASFDMFTGYAQRGDVFRQAVRSLSPRKKETVR